MISKKTQIVELAEGLVNAGIDMACKHGIRGVLINHAFSNHCTSGRNRLLDLKEKFNDYLITHTQNLGLYIGEYAEIVNAYDYNCILKHTVLNRYFYYYLKNNYLKGAKNEKSIS